MTQSETQEIRANENGHPCPSWCTQDHGRPLIPGKPEHGLSDGHWSGFNAQAGGLMTRLTQHPAMDTEPRVCLTNTYGMNPVFFSLDQAERLATLLELNDDPAAGLLQAAVTTAREAA